MYLAARKDFLRDFLLPGLQAKSLQGLKAHKEDKLNTHNMAQYANRIATFTFCWSRVQVGWVRKGSRLRYQTREYRGTVPRITRYETGLTLAGALNSALILPGILSVRRIEY
jgi:hypothetical protein